MDRGWIFTDRVEAGRQLARELATRDYVDPVVLALPRGGVPVAAEIARALAAPLDLVLVRKIGVPYQPELALAAVVDGEHPEVIVNTDVWRMAGVSEEAFSRLQERELAEIERRRDRYLQGRDRVATTGTTAILVDDGIATGATVRAAVRALRRSRPARLVLAVPVAPEDTLQSLAHEVDEIVCLHTPYPFHAIGSFYRDFSQLTDQQVVDLLTHDGSTASQ
ncbi:phosphoribosyltransferase [Spiribacter halobius]|uniref:Phosphoribosyltransferase n=1 Tax=Sediminicurvatus halobius TaxID=2182432 RepID=A0A2U2N565_9GAMM|nr:phosphoribosyltransferase [Spiribacter halobius]PWG64250.1 phosphoribosyltransferase [Spiribacter halobius]UEX79415.1 phosphoribosyltransferase [Spiribacter halobius]